MIKRLPISLKFEDTSEDFYTDFIEPKKNDKELTTFITDLLKAYYYNDDIRMRVDSYIIDQNPYIKIHEQLQKITMQHKRHANAISMLSDYTTKEVEKRSSVEEEEEEKDKGKKDDDEKAELLRLLQKYGVNLQEEKVEKPVTEVETRKVEEFATAPIIQQDTAPIISIGGEEEAKKVPKAFKKMMGSVK